VVLIKSVFPNSALHLKAFWCTVTLK